MTAYTARMIARNIGGENSMDASVKGKVIRIGGFNAYPGVVEHEQHTAFIKSLCEHIGEGHWRVTFLESKTSKSVVIEKAR